MQSIAFCNQDGTTTTKLSFAEAQPFTGMSNVTVLIEVTNKLQVPQRSSLKISHLQNVKLLQFILRLNILHKP